MPEYKKGQSGNRAGRPKGTPNKATAEAREAFKNLLDKNTPQMQKWLDQVAMEDPAKAMDLVLSIPTDGSRVVGSVSGTMTAYVSFAFILMTN